MCMKVCLCMGVCVSLGDGGNVGSQGRTGGGDGVGSVPLVVRSLFSFGGSVILKI